MQSMFEVFRALATERVNCELMFTDTDDVGFMVTCRLRPWKNGMNTGRMILSGGRSPHEAIVYAYWGLINARWLPLDWSSRAVSNGCVEQPIERIGKSLGDHNPFVDPAEVLRLVETMYHTGGAPLEPLEPIVGSLNGTEEKTPDPPKRK